MRLVSGHIGALGAFALITLAACSKEDKPLEAAVPAAAERSVVSPFLELTTTPFVLAGGGEADLGALVSALPDIAALTWTEKSFEAETGATVFSGLSFGLEVLDTAVGIRFDEARIWGLQTDLLTARLGGERLSEAGPLFARLDGTGVSYFGLAEVSNALVEAILDAAARSTDQPTSLDIDIEFGTFELKASRLVMTEAALRPWELVRAPASLLDELDLDEAEQASLLDAVHLGQHMVAVSRSLQYGNVVMLDTAGTFSMEAPGQTVDAAMSWDMYGYSGVSGFDSDLAVIQNSRVRQETNYRDPNPEAGEGMGGAILPQGTQITQEETTGLTQVEDLRLDRLMGFVARGEVPGMAERDLLSFGRWQMADYDLRLNDKLVFSADRAAVNADKFVWIIPTDIGYTVEAGSIEFSELTGFFQLLFEGFAAEADPESADEAQAEEQRLLIEGLRKAIDLLPEHGLERVTFNASGQGKWDADTGPAAINFLFEADGFGDVSFDIGGVLPTYEKAIAAYEAEDREAAFTALLEETLAFTGFRFNERDEGGYNKILGFAQAIGKEYPDEGWGATLANMDPPQMRTYVATLVRMGVAQVQGTFEPAAAWLKSYADYFETGGAFEIRVDPPQPITKALLDSYEDEPTPDEIVEILGISVTHTK